MTQRDKDKIKVLISEAKVSTHDMKISIVNFLLSLLHKIRPHSEEGEVKKWKIPIIRIRW